VGRSVAYLSLTAYLRFRPALAALNFSSLHLPYNGQFINIFAIWQCREKDKLKWTMDSEKSCTTPYRHSKSNPRPPATGQSVRPMRLIQAWPRI
jgi:hypothetical protein